MNFKRYHVSRNLCPATDWEYGQYVTGVWTETQSRMTSPWIPIEGGNAYYLSINDNGDNLLSWINLNYFDENKQWLGNRVTLGMESFSPTSHFIPTPAFPNDAKYLRVVVRGYNEVSYPTPQKIIDSNIQVNKTAVHLPYEPYGNTWVDSHYIRNTSIDTLTLPAVIYGDGTNASLAIKGNEEHTGTPSPSNPVMPQGTGDMSSNLYNVSDKSATTNNIVTLVDLGADTTVNTITVSCMFDNLLSTGAYGAFLDFLKDDNTHQYVTLSNMHNVADDTPVIANTITTGNYYATKNNITFRYIKAYLYSTAYNKFQSGTIKWAFYDSEKKDYEPYGIKIPILNNSQTTNVYLGEVETTRQVKKLVLTGEETIGKYPYLGTDGFYIDSVLATHYNRAEGVCTHYPVRTTSVANSLWIGVSNRTLYFVGIGTALGITDVDDFKQFLRDQYAAGTPVCVWYVLATPTTGIVNEPLMKIGEYADTVSNISIPVTAGANSLSVGTTVQPSEVSATYHGWHPVAAAHEYNSNYTIATMQALTIAQLQTHTISDLQGGEWS